MQSAQEYEDCFRIVEQKELNQERYTEEIHQGLHARKKPKRTTSTVERTALDGRAEPEGILC